MLVYKRISNIKTNYYATLGLTISASRPLNRNVTLQLPLTETDQIFLRCPLAHVVANPVNPYRPGFRPGQDWSVSTLTVWHVLPEYQTTYPFCKNVPIPCV